MRYKIINFLRYVEKLCAPGSNTFLSFQEELSRTIPDKKSATQIILEIFENQHNIKVKEEGENKKQT